MKHTKLMAGVMAIALLLLTLGGCAGKPDTDSKVPTLNVAFCAPYVSDEGLKAFEKSLAETNEDVKAGKVKLNFIQVATGDADADPMANMASIMKITSMIAAKELDVIIADNSNAQRNARGESFIPLSELLTAEEISALGDRALSYDMVDDEGKATGEKTPVCGIDISGREALKSVLGDEPVGIFAVVNTQNLDLTKSVIKSIAAL